MSDKPQFNYVKGTFSFGKYKDHQIEEVFEEDRKYCEWFLKTMDDGSKHKIYVKQKIRELIEAHDD